MLLGQLSQTYARAKPARPDGRRRKLRLGAALLAAEERPGALERYVPSLRADPTKEF